MLGSLGVGTEDFSAPETVDFERYREGPTGCGSLDGRAMQGAMHADHPAAPSPQALYHFGLSRF